MGAAAKVVQHVLVLLHACFQLSQADLTEGLYLVKAQRSSVASTCSAQAATGQPAATGLYAQFFSLASSNGEMPDTTGVDPIVVRSDKTIYYPQTLSAWTGLSITDHFAARWTGGLVIINAGSYTLGVNSDDGSWIYVDGELVVDNGGYHSMRFYTGTVELSAGVHEVQLEFFEATWDAGMEFYYSGPDTSGRTVIVPPCALTPAAPGSAVASGGVAAEFMYQVVHGYSPVVVAARMVAGLVITQAGTYTFSMTTHVGALLLVDGERVLEQYDAGAITTTTASVTLTSGRHEIKMELFATSVHTDLSFSYSGPDTDDFFITAPACAVTPTEPTSEFSDAVGGLKLEVYFTASGLDSLVAVPDFSGIAPDLVRVDKVVNYHDDWTTFTLLREDHFAARWSGRIHITVAGTYEFSLESDDGSLLYIDDTLVVNNDGIHGDRLRSASAVLTSGWHALRLEYFQFNGGKSVKLRYSGLDTGNTDVAVPACVLSPGQPT